MQEIKVPRLRSREKKGGLPTPSMKGGAVICACHSQEGDQEIALTPHWLLSGVIPWGC